MVQQVTLHNGEVYEFPDDATQEEINAQLNQIAPPITASQQIKNKMIDILKNTIDPGLLKPSAMQNIAGGALAGVTGIANLLPGTSIGALSKMAQKEGLKPIPEFDPYKAVGTTEQPITTVAGMEQALGEFSPAIGDIPAMYKIGKAALSKGAQIANAPIQKFFGSKDAANNLINQLGHGATNAEEALTSLGQDIRTPYQARKEEASAFYNFPLQQAGGERIYDKVNPLISTAVDKEKEMLNAVKDLKIGDLYENFAKDPTFDNAHKLQSQLGVMLGDLKSTFPKDADIRNKISKIHSIREQLKSDIHDFLGRRDQSSNINLLPMYQRATKLYEQNVVPFLSSKKLRDLLLEGKQTVKNLHNVFEYPTNYINPATGVEEQGPIHKIMEELSPESADKILFLKTNAANYKDNPVGLADAIEKARNSGFSKHINNNVNEKIADILQKESRKKLTKKSTKIAGFGSLLAIPEMYRLIKGEE